MKTNGILKFAPTDNGVRREVINAIKNLKNVRKNIAIDDGVYSLLDVPVNHNYFNENIGSVIRYVG